MRVIEVEIKQEHIDLSFAYRRLHKLASCGDLEAKKKFKEIFGSSWCWGACCPIAMCLKEKFNIRSNEINYVTISPTSIDVHNEKDGKRIIKALPTAESYSFIHRVDSDSCGERIAPEKFLLVLEKSSPLVEGEREATNAEKNNIIEFLKSNHLGFLVERMGWGIEGSYE